MVINLSLPLEEDMLIFPGQSSFQYDTLESFEEDRKRLHYFSASTHQGTHIDAPAHYVEDGKTIDEVATDVFLGEGHVVDLREQQGDPIDAEILEEETPGLSPGDRVVFVTGDVDRLPHDKRFFDNASHFTEDAAEWIVNQDLSLIANDFLTEAVPGDPNRPVHRKLLRSDLVIVEYLANIEEITRYDSVEFISLPLFIPGFEAAPARAIAIPPE